MPVSVATARDPFRGPAPHPAARGRPALRVPQARLLRALLPDDPADPPFLWPLLTRPALAVKAGYTAISGTVTRALNGIAAGAASTKRARAPEVPHLGLLGLGYVEEDVLDIDGVKEVNYRATIDGVAAYRLFIAAGGALPPVKDAATCINERYTRKG